MTPHVANAAPAQIHIPTAQTHEPPKRKPISDAKLAANRRNAKLSTGPRTKQGKKNSRRNAITHGILSSVLLVDGKEDEAAFQGILRGLRLEYQPRGQSEELLVDEIANCWWRLRRALRFEGDAIALSAERQFLTGEGDATPEEAMQLFREVVADAEKRACAGVEDIRSALRRISSLSKDEFCTALARVRAKRYLDICGEQDLRALAKEFGLEPAFQAAITLRTQEGDAAQWFKYVPVNTRLTLPTEQDLSRLLRYRSSIYRELAQSMNQLERLQRSRKGEHVPAPLHVNLSTNK